MKFPWPLVVGIAIGTLAGNISMGYLMKNYPDIASGVALPLGLLAGAGVILLTITGRINEWLNSPRMIFP